MNHADVPNANLIYMNYPEMEPRGSPVPQASPILTRALQDQPLPTPALTVVSISAQAPGVQIVERAWTVDELLARRSAEGAPVWTDGGELIFFYQGEAAVAWAFGTR